MITAAEERVNDDRAATRMMDVIDGYESSSFVYCLTFWPSDLGPLVNVVV